MVTTRSRLSAVSAGTAKQPAKKAKKARPTTAKQPAKKAKLTTAKQQKSMKTPPKIQNNDEVDDEELISFVGKTFLITGEFEMGKYALQNLITSKGGKIVASCSKSLGYLVCGKPGTTAYSGKTGKGTKNYKEAKKLRKPIVDEAWIIRQTITSNKGASAAVVDIFSVWRSILESHAALGHPLTCTSAKEEDISDAEERIGYPMPLQMKQLYQLTNGIPRDNKKNGGIPIPSELQFCKIEKFQPNNSYVRHFYHLMRMWCLNEYVHIDSSGLIFEWDTSFDSQCGNKIVAESLVEYLKRWADELQTHVQKVMAARDVLSSSSSASAATPAGDSGRSNVPSLPIEIASMVVDSALSIPEFRLRDYNKEVDIDKSVPHKSWFKKFRTAYSSSFGTWPQYAP